MNRLPAMFTMIEPGEFRSDRATGAGRFRFVIKVIKGADVN
jgi:hypothetical protein